jgi:hypothetical protein
MISVQINLFISILGHYYLLNKGLALTKYYIRSVQAHANFQIFDNFG